MRLAVDPATGKKAQTPTVLMGHTVTFVDSGADAETSAAGPIVIPTGTFYGPNSYVTVTSGWDGTVEIVNFSGTVLATTTINTTGEFVDGIGVYTTPFTTNFSVGSDTPVYLRLTNNDAGGSVLLGWYFEVFTTGIAPVATVAPSIDTTPLIGDSVDYTTPTTSPAYDTVVSVSMYRDGEVIPELDAVDVATLDAYTYVADDIGPTLTLAFTVSLNGYQTTTTSAGVVFDDATYFPDTAIWANPDNSTMTLADSDTTVDQWASGWGGVSSTLTAPASNHRPGYSTGGVSGRPILTFDGTDDFLRGSFTKGSAFTTHEIGIVGERVSFGILSDYWFGYWVPNGGVFFLSDQDASRWRFTSGGAANVAPSTTYDPDGVLAHYSGDAAPGDLNARVNGVSVATSAASPVSRADGNTVVMGASQVSTVGPYGTVASNIIVHAAYLGPALSADQRTHLRALLTYLTGVAS